MKQSPLESIGLSPAGSAIYSLLLEKGPLPASRISRLSGVERSLSYVVLQDLIDKKLVVKNTETKVARFAPLHPQNLETLVETKKQEAETAGASLQAVFHQLQQQFEIQSGQPGIRFFDGAAGLRRVNKDLKTADIAEMLLIRTIKSSRDVPEYQPLIHEQQALRVKRNIPLKVITPSIKTLKEKIKTDKQNLTERRIIAKEVLDTESQILIYGDTIAITTFSDPTITTIIDNHAIAKTITCLFNYMWRMSMKETAMFVEKYS